MFLNNGKDRATYKLKEKLGRLIYSKPGKFKCISSALSNPQVPLADNLCGISIIFQMAGNGPVARLEAPYAIWPEDPRVKSS